MFKIIFTYFSINIDFLVNFVYNIPIESMHFYWFLQAGKSYTKEGAI